MIIVSKSKYDVVSIMYVSTTISMEDAKKREIQEYGEPVLIDKKTDILKLDYGNFIIYITEVSN